MDMMENPHSYKERYIPTRKGRSTQISENESHYSGGSRFPRYALDGDWEKSPSNSWNKILGNTNNNNGMLFRDKKGYGSNIVRYTDSMASIDIESNEKAHRDLGDIFNHFSEMTSIGGLAWVQQSSRWWSTAFWIIIVICSSVACGLHLYSIFAIYYDWPFSTITRTQFSQLDFPSVTVCNLNPITISGGPEMTEEMQTFLQSFGPQANNNLGNGENTNGDGDQSNTATLQPPSSSDAGASSGGVSGASFGSGQPPNRRKRSLSRKKRSQVGTSGVPPSLQGFQGNPATQNPQGEVSSSVSTAFSNYEKFLVLYGNQTVEARELAGHQGENFIVSCTFNGYECSYENFSIGHSPEYGNCYTFNNPFYQDVPYMSRQTGKNTGLTLTLFADTEEYPSGVTETYGFSASVHTFNAQAFPEITGMYISPGYETNIALKYRNVTKLGLPWTNCTPADSYFKDYGVLYTQQACLSTCYYHMFIEHCQCYLAPFEEYYSSNDTLEYPKCYEYLNVNCTDAVTEAYKTGDLECICYPGCSETYYQMLMSSALWPAEYMIDTYTKKVCDGLSDRSCETLTIEDRTFTENRTFIGLNFGVLNVFYDELTYQSIEEQASIDMLQLASDVGGTIGLWIGVSMLTGIEILQLISELCRHSYRTVFGRHPVKSAK